MTFRVSRAALAAAGFGLLCGSAPGSAQLAVSANDGKQVLVDGVPKVPAPLVPDTVSILDLSVSPPKMVAELEVPASVAGPPTSVAVAPDESFALVSAAQSLDPLDPTKVAFDDRLTVVDLKTNPPRVIATHKVGKGAAGVAINRAGTLALVANRAEGTVSVFTLKGNVLSPAGDKIALGDRKSVV